MLSKSVRQAKNGTILVKVHQQPKTCYCHFFISSSEHVLWGCVLCSVFYQVCVFFMLFKLVVLSKQRVLRWPSSTISGPLIQFSTYHLWLGGEKNKSYSKVSWSKKILVFNFFIFFQTILAFSFWRFTGRFNFNELKLRP